MTGTTGTTGYDGYDRYEERRFAGQLLVLESKKQMAGVSSFRVPVVTCRTRRYPSYPVSAGPLDPTNPMAPHGPPRFILSYRVVK